MKHAKQLKSQFIKPKKSISKKLPSKTTFKTLSLNENKLNLKKKQFIKKTLQLNHRNTIEKTTKNAQKIWKLIKWAKNKHTFFKSTISFLQKFDDIMILIRKNKIQYLIDFFFSSTTTNLKNIQSNETYSKCILFFSITKKKISHAIINKISNKIFDENEILNRILKLIFSIIKSIFKWIYNQNLQLSYCSKNFKKSITMIFRKINKSDYFIFKTYRFIALFNTMKKIMKSIMITRLNYAAKKHNLLSRNHFEDKKNIVFEHALHYITKKIHSTWINKKMTFMLLLNVIETFDNVFHFKLLHILRKKNIKNFYTTWLKNFLFDRHTIFKLINHIINRFETFIKIFQDFSMSLIFYVFYNAEIIKRCIDSSLNMTITNFIDDIIIFVIENNAKDNLNKFHIIHEKFDQWTKIHESLFNKFKYELIHFRRYSRNEKFEMILKLLKIDVISFSKCKYLKMIMNCQFI